MDKEPDDVLYDRWIGGDGRAANLLVMRHEESLRHFFMTRAPESDCPDLVQETLYNLTKSLSKFKKESSFATFVRGIANHILARYYRKNTRGQKVSLDGVESIVDSNQDVERLFQTYLNHGHASRALSRLRWKDQDVLTRYYGEHQFSRDIGEHYGVVESTVRSMLRNARQRMQASVIEVQTEDPFLSKC